MCDWVERPPDPRDRCFVANTNIRRAEQASLSSPVRPPLPATAWDGKARPAMLDRVDAHVHLTQGEEAMLARSGFVVLDRLAYDSYASAFHDVFQQQLPVYVGIDAILHSVFQSNGAILQHIETERLQPRLVSMLERLRKTLAASREAYDATTRGDLDVYLAVARRLVRGYAGDEEKMSLFGQDALVSDLVQQIVQRAAPEGAPGGGQGLWEVALFGRPRMIDFSQYTPRGHYVGSVPMGSGSPVDLAAYFQAMTWLSRLEYNLVSRSCRSSQPGMTPDPTETPREARDAMALADLVSRAGVLADLKAFEDVYSVFAGGREDVSVPDMLALMKAAGTSPGDRDGPAKLRAAIGNGFQRTARTHFMPQGSPVLPAILTLFGPRIVPDIAPLTRLVHDSVQGRYVLGAADVAYVLGHDRAKVRLQKDLVEFPSLGGALDGARAEIKRTTGSRKDLYALWLSAVLKLADPAAGVVPSFTRSEAYADFRMNSALVGFAQIRHNYVLLAGQGYDSYGCEIPDGYVEPALGTYDALLAYAGAARAVDPKHEAYFRRVEQVLSTLRAIVVTELSGAPLSEPQRRWLGMVAEYIPTGGWGGDSGQPPKWTGWYFDLFPDREIGAEKAAGFVADYFTLTNASQVRYLGADVPRVGVFVVDVNGAPRAMVGPVAKGYEVSTPIGPRLDDEAAAKAEGKSAEWLGYLAPRQEPAQPITVQEAECDGQWRVAVTSPAPLGTVTVTLLDHHGDPAYPPVTQTAGAGTRVFSFALPPSGPAPATPLPFARGATRRAFEGAHVHVHDLGATGSGHGRYDIVTGVGAGRISVPEGAL
jgi:hypothetical protein